MFSQRPGCIMGPTRARLNRAPDLLKSISNAMQVCCEVWQWQGVSPSTLVGLAVESESTLDRPMEILALPPGQANVKRERHCQPQMAIPSPDRSPQIQLYSRSCYLTWQGGFPQLQRNMLKLAAVFPHLPNLASSLYTEELQ